MSQLGFFDVANRYAGLDAKNDPLLKIDSVVPWDDFRLHLEAVWRKPANERKSSAGRKPWDGRLRRCGLGCAGFICHLMASGFIAMTVLTDAFTVSLNGLMSALL